VKKLPEFSLLFSTAHHSRDPLLSTVHEDGTVDKIFGIYGKLAMTLWRGLSLYDIPIRLYSINTSHRLTGISVLSGLSKQRVSAA